MRKLLEECLKIIEVVLQFDLKQATDIKES